MSNYSEKLKDPRWQKKRLEILERDSWMCVSCQESGKTLHVHHTYYEKNKEPWEHDNFNLITLCEDCHESETANRKISESRLIDTLKKLNYMTIDVHALSHIISELRFPGPPEVGLSVMEFTLNNKEICDMLFNKYLEIKREINGKNKSHSNI